MLVVQSYDFSLKGMILLQKHCLCLLAWVSRGNFNLYFRISGQDTMVKSSFNVSHSPDTEHSYINHKRKVLINMYKQKANVCLQEVKTEKH